MKRLTRIVLLILLMIPFTSNGQSISDNLRYINEQFRQYNNYETSFKIDEYNKEIICEDKFSVLKAKFEDIEVRTEGNNIGIFCLNSSNECIRDYEKDGTLKNSGHKDYTMGLRENEELIPHINMVLNKFAEIKSAVLGEEVSSNSMVNTTIETQINNINVIFRYSSEYKNIWRFDYSKNAIIGKTENCEVIVPINSGLSINSYTREETYGNGWYFSNADNSIIEACTSFKNNTKETYEYVYSTADARRVIAAFNEIIKLKRNESGTVAISTYGNENISSNLAYINEQFGKYNAYNTRFKIDNSTKKLIWTHDFGTNYAYLKDIEVRADYKSNWIGIYCINGKKCVWQISNSDSRTEYKDYTMSLKDNGNMIEHMNIVVQKFAEMKQLVLGNSSSSVNDDSDSPD